MGTPSSRRLIPLRRRTRPGTRSPDLTNAFAAEAGARTTRHNRNTAGYQYDAKIDWKALSHRIGHSDVAFTMKQYVQTDLEADRKVANTLAELIIGGSLVSMEVSAT